MEKERVKEFIDRTENGMGFVPRENMEEKPPISLEAQEMGVVDGSKAYKVLKKLLEENVSYEKGLKNIKQHIEDKVRKSFEVDLSISDKLSDRLFTETVVELQLIEQMIDKVLKGKDRNNGKERD